MNPFTNTARRMIELQGRMIVYKSVVDGEYDPQTSLVTKTVTDYNVKAYKKQIKISHYSNPNLVTKDTADFYILVQDLNTSPKPQDLIFDGEFEYTVDSFVVYEARGEKIYYKVLAVKA